MVADRVALETHRDYEGSVEEAAGVPPSEDQLLRAAELIQLDAAIENHADLLDGIEVQLLAAFGSTVGDTFATLRADIDNKENVGVAAALDLAMQALLQNNIDAKEDAGVAATLDAVIQASVDANSAANALQQAAIDANAADNASQQVDIDALLAAPAVDITNKENVGVAAALDSALRSDIDDNEATNAAQDDRLDADDVSDASLEQRVETLELQIISEFAVYATLQHTSDYTMGLVIEGPHFGLPPYSGVYDVKFSFVDSDQNSRVVAFTGSLTTAVAGQVGFSGTVGDISIDNALADIYGGITAIITTTDSGGNIATKSV